LFLTSLSLWWLAVYALHVAIRGNPLIVHVAAASPALLAAADAAAADDDGVAVETTQFLRGFSLRMVVGFAMLVLEFGLLVRLFWLDIMPWLAMALLVRGLVAIAVGSIGTGSLDRQGGMFSTLLALPPWVLRLDRVNALVSGVGALAFLYVLVRS